MSGLSTLIRAVWPRSSDPDTHTVTRMRATLLSMLLAARVVHVCQALIDVSVGGAAFAHRALAVVVAVSCVLESGWLAVVLVRAARIRLDVLVADAVFGGVALLVLGVAMSGSAGRLTSLNWMLPYTVGTAAGLGLALSGPACRRQLVTATAAFLFLVCAYAPSVLLFGREPDERIGDLVANAVNYPLFFGGGLALALVVRRRAELIVSLREQATSTAAEASRQATLARLTQDLFSPVLDIMDAVANHPEGIAEHRERVLDLRDQIDDMALDLMNAQRGNHG